MCLIDFVHDALCDVIFGMKQSLSLLVSFMRSAQLQSGNAMKIFRFRDRLAGGALYSGRWGEIPNSYLLSLK